MKKLLSLLLVLAFCIGLLAVPAAADDFVIDANGVLTKYNGPGGDVVIPNGVTKIGTSAFSGCSTLTSVSIPEGVTSIGDQAFFNCSNMRSVTIPGSVTEIGNAVFLVCLSLNTITVAAGNTAYCSIDGVLFNKAATKLITCPGGKSGAYSIPGGVTSIDYNAFSSCTKLTSIAIPGSLQEIRNAAFSSCSSLAAFTVASDNPSFAVIDGVLFNKALSSLIAYPGGKSGAVYSVPDSVTSIGNTAFNGCGNLTSVTIPSGVTEIGTSVFFSCPSLAAITVASGNSAFADVDGVLFNKAATKLISYPGGRSGAYTVPDGVTSIDMGAFGFCTKLTAITIPSSVTTICQSAFLVCSSLTDVTYLGTEAQWKAITIESGNEALKNATIHYNGAGGSAEVVPEDWLYSIQDGEVIIQRYIGHGATITIPSVLEGCPVTSIGSSAFQSCTSVECITIPNGVKSIGLQAFWMCGNLKTITIPESVTSIGSLAFGDCSSLTAVVIPNGVTGIEKSTFSGCSSLKTVEIPNTVTTIGENAFYKCSALESVTIPDHVTSIGRMAFEGCSSITSVTVPSGVTSISDYAFSSCSNLKSASLPNGVTSIGQSAFMHCGLLENLVIPNSVTSIGAGAFQDCSSLTSINIPRGVTRIENYAFMRCGFTSIVLPDGVTYIGDGAFSTCKSLKTVWIPASLKEIGKSVFNATTGALTDIYYGGSEAQWKEIVIGDNNSYLTRVTIHYDTVPPTPVPVTPSQPTADPWITAAEYADDALTLTAKGGITAPVFLAAYDKESGKMAGVYPAECKDGQYKLPVGADAAEYDWKLMFVDARSSAPLTCDYRLTFPA